MRGLLFRSGALVRTLEPGAYRWWAGCFRLRRVDVRPWVLQVPVQEVPTADGVTVKVTVAGRVRVTGPAAYVTEARDPLAALYLAVQVPCASSSPRPRSRTWSPGGPRPRC